MKLKLIRLETSHEGTFGLVLFAGSYLYTGELPWRDNRPNISCIPTGTYSVQVRNSPRYGKCFTVIVSGRTYILFHQGNFSGDRDLGYRSNTNGCILLGSRRGKIYGQQSVLASRSARTRFEAALNWRPFQLEVTSVWNG